MQKLPLLVLSLLIATGTKAEEIDTSYINQLNPLYFHTAFAESGKVLSIRMLCGAGNRPSCPEATQKLAELTGSVLCREHFFVAIIDLDGIEADDVRWLQYAYIIERRGSFDIKVDTPEDTPAPLACGLQADVMREEIRRIENGE